MTIILERLNTLGTIRLDRGGHDSFDDGHCAMEVVAWLAGEGNTDAPQCVSPVLGAFTRNINDAWDDEQRQRLVPLLPRMVGTAGDGQDQARSFLAFDWLVRTYTPAWLDLVGQVEPAQALRDLAPLVDEASVEAAAPLVHEARDAVETAAEAGAQAAAWDAAEAAASTTARAAIEAEVAWGVARDAGAAAASTTAWAASATAAKGAARNAIWNAVWATAEAAAADAAQAAVETVNWDAARDVAWAALAPTVATLQESAFELLDRMIDPT